MVGGLLIHPMVSGSSPPSAKLLSTSEENRKRLQSDTE